MSSDDARKFFDDAARGYDRRFAPSARATREDLDALLEGVRAGATVLDVGCGTGRAWPHLVDRSLRVVAFDASMPMLRESSKRASSSEVTRLRADLYAPWPIADRCIDVVLALHAVIAHPPGNPVDSWRRVGAEIARVITPGARIAIDVPTPEWAHATLRALGDDRFVTPEGVVAVIPHPNVIVAALGLPLTVTRTALGVRLRS